MKRKGTWSVSAQTEGVEEAGRSHGERWEAKCCWGEEGRLRACVCWGCGAGALFCPGTAPALSFMGVPGSADPPGQAARSKALSTNGFGGKGSEMAPTGGLLRPA